MRTPTPLALAACLALCACTEAGGSSFARASAEPRSGYPAGPYGTAEGAVIADLDFVTPDGGALSLAEVHADGGNRLLLVTTAAGWCTACIEEQPRIQALHETWYDDGLFVLVPVFEDADFNPATAALAADWKARYGLDVAVVADPPFRLADFYDPTLTPMTMIVDVDSMEIIWMTTGWDQSSVEAILASRLR